MTALTAQQMRELADLDALDYRFRMNEIRAALRTAADQLEAVRSAVTNNSFQAFDGEAVVYSDLVMVALEEIAEDNK